MKKLIIAIVATVAIGTTAFAADVNSEVSKTIMTKFKSQFVDVTDVSWKIEGQYSKASFLTNGERMEAYYDNTATLFATCKAVNIEKLPVQAQKKIEKNFAGYTLKECIEVDIAEESSSYYASYSNDAYNVILKIEQSGAVSVYKKEKK